MTAYFRRPDLLDRSFSRLESRVGRPRVTMTSQRQPKSGPPTLSAVTLLVNGGLWLLMRLFCTSQKSGKARVEAKNSLRLAHA